MTFLSSIPAISKPKLETIPNESDVGLKEAPTQWADFNFSPYGSGSDTGNLLEDGVDTMSVNSGSYGSTSGEYYKGYIKPGIQGSESNADILTQWNNADGPPHWSKLDEFPIEGDGGNIRENSVGKCDKWKFTSLSLAPGEYVTKLVYWAYIKEQASTTSTYVDIDTSASTSGSWTPTGTSYQWKSYTKSGLSLSQSQLDGFWLQAKVADVYPWMEFYDPGWVDINTVYVKVYVKQQYGNYKHDWTVMWDVTDVDMTSIDALYYDYRATSDVTTTMQIWNYDTTSWNTVESNPGTNWIIDSFSLSPTYISVNDEVKLRFSTTVITTGVFLLEFDQLYLSYSTETTPSGFLYAQSSEEVDWTMDDIPFSWEDEDVAINSVGTPGEYLVIYTANFYAFSMVEGYGWVTLVTDAGEIARTKRFFEDISQDMYGTIVVADRVTLGAGGVRAKLDFFDGVTFTLIQRSIIAIPLAPDCPYISSTESAEWQDNTIREDLRIDDLTGEYLAIYTASFQVTDDPGSLHGVHSNGWVRFADADTSGLFDHTIRQWEFPAYQGDMIMRGTMIIADKLSLDNTDLVVELRFMGRGYDYDPVTNDKLTILERSLILMPLPPETLYDYRTDTVSYEDLDQDIGFENVNFNYNCFVVYTSNFRFFDDAEISLLDCAEGTVWSAFHDFIDETYRTHNYGYGYGNTFQQTNSLIEVLELQGQDIWVEYTFFPDDNEEFSIRQRSMIIIPFIP
ncbi:MAG: hypothetical protein ACFFAI_06010 [Promethearchaeota archaeon]